MEMVRLPYQSGVVLYFCIMVCQSVRLSQFGIKLAEMCGCEIVFVDFGDESEVLGFTAFNDMEVTVMDALMALNLKILVR